MAGSAVEMEGELECVLWAAPIPARPIQESILLIEDSEDAMWLVRYALEEHGRGRYRLSWASNLSQGLSRLMDGGIDIVLLDLGLPDSTGPDSFMWIREVSPKVPVVVLTGNASEETEFSVTASGVASYLVKDQVSGSILLQTIRTALYAQKHPRPMACKLFTPRFRVE